MLVDAFMWSCLLGASNDGLRLGVESFEVGLQIDLTSLIQRVKIRYTERMVRFSQHVKDIPGNGCLALLHRASGVLVLRRRGGTHQSLLENGRTG